MEVRINNKTSTAPIWQLKNLKAQRTNILYSLSHLVSLLWQEINAHNHELVVKISCHVWNIPCLKVSQFSAHFGTRILFFHCFNFDGIKLFAIKKINHVEYLTRIIHYDLFVYKIYISFFSHVGETLWITSCYYRILILRALRIFPSII